MVVSWILIIVVGLVALFLVNKVIHFNHFKHKLSAILIILLVLFLYSTFVVVTKSNNIDLKTAQGLLSAGKVYFSWLIQAFGNVKQLTGNVVNMNWMPSNMSISSAIGN